MSVWRWKCDHGVCVGDCDRCDRCDRDVDADEDDQEIINTDKEE